MVLSGAITEKGSYACLRWKFTKANQLTVFITTHFLIISFFSWRWSLLQLKSAWPYYGPIMFLSALVQLDYIRWVIRHVLWCKHGLQLVMMTILIFFSTKQNRTDNDPAFHCAAAAVIRRRNLAPRCPLKVFVHWASRDRPTPWQTWEGKKENLSHVVC